MPNCSDFLLFTCIARNLLLTNPVLYFQYSKNDIGKVFPNTKILKDFVLYEIITSIISVNGDLNLPTSFNLTLAQNYYASSHAKIGNLKLLAVIIRVNTLGGLQSLPNVFWFNKHFH